MLKNKVAIVTGGSRGIGYAVVRKFLENGAKVILLSSRQETADHAVASLKSENPDWDVAGAYPDLMDEKQVKDFVNTIVHKYGRIDILVNNAGISDNTPLDNYTLDTFRKVFDLNVNAVMNMIIPVSGIMKAQKSGVILSTSSMVSICGQPSGVAYPASKTALNGLTWSLARELAPGITRTDMVSALPDSIIKPLIQSIPLRRIGEPEDVANAFLFLASDMAAYITGEILSVDGAMRC